MPGDELVGEATYRRTLENLFGLDMHSAERIQPALQKLEVGEVVRLVPEGTEPALRFKGVVAQLQWAFAPPAVPPRGSRRAGLTELGRAAGGIKTFRSRVASQGRSGLEGRVSGKIVLLVD